MLREEMGFLSSLAIVQRKAQCQTSSSIPRSLLPKAPNDISFILHDRELKMKNNCRQGCFCPSVTERNTASATASSPSLQWISQLIHIPVQ